MSIIPHDCHYPEDCLPIEAAIWWRDNVALFLAVLTQPKYRRIDSLSGKSGNLLIYPPECNINEEKMNGRKPTKPSSGLGSGSSKSVPFQWINVSLTAEDFDILERETASLDQLALAYISLGVQRLGLSIKYDSSRESFSVSIYGPDLANNGQPCGVSGAASELRDALLVTLYRFNHGLQGSFDGKSNSSAAIQSRRFK